MKKERRITVLSIAINSLITFVKIYGGLVFCSYTLMVSGYNTLANALIDFSAFSGSVARGRRASRKEPFGYGKKECLASSTIGFIVFLTGIFIILKTFFLEFDITNIKILLVMALLILSEYLYSNYLFKNSKSIQSEMLMDMAHTEYYLTSLDVVTVFFVFLSNIMPVFDLLGSLFLGSILIYKGINIVKYNYTLINCQNVRSKKIINAIEHVIKNGDGIHYSNCTLVNTKNYYKAIIEIEIK